MTFFNWQNQQVMQASQLSLLIVGLLELQKNVYGGPLKDCYLDSLWWKFWSSNTPSQLAMINRHPKSSRGSFLADLWVFAQRVEIAAATIVMFSSLVWSLETAKMMNDVAKYTVKNSISLSSFFCIIIRYSYGEMKKEIKTHSSLDSHCVWNWFLLWIVIYQFQFIDEGPLKKGMAHSFS